MMDIMPFIQSTGPLPVRSPGFVFLTLSRFLNVTTYSLAN